MPVHTLERTQIIQSTLETAWNFFSDPRNLEKITPPSLGFQILSQLPDKMYPGMMIRYRVSPLMGVPMTWVTEITQVEEGRRFIDEQRVGPYRMWHHEHHFRELGDGRIEMLDRVTYQLPFGWLSEPVHALIVLPQLSKIFQHREMIVRDMFG
ncbi:MAG: SRPBCC family protein [Verrucomicrobia bacterium]|nr:SRPBCC family protein [Verrucomicrobiota bacterium]